VFEAKGVVLGFLISTGHTLRCLYVKHEFRGHRIGLQLVTARWPGFVQLVVHRPTPSFLRWASLHGIVWTHLGSDGDREAA